jgi:hypothetical protein
VNAYELLCSTEIKLIRCQPYSGNVMQKVWQAELVMKLWRMPRQGVGPSGEGLGLEGLLPSRSKVQHLMGANNSLGPHPIVKS